MSRLGKRNREMDARSLRPLINLAAAAGTSITDYQLTSDVDHSVDTTITVNRIPTGITANSFWVIIDPYTTDCEIRKVTNISGNTLTVGDMTYDHLASDGVIFTTAPICNVKWWGAKGDGSTDDTTALQRASLAAKNLGTVSSANVSDYGVCYFPGGRYVISGSITIYEFVNYIGDGIGITEISLANSANVDIFVTNGFNTYSVLGDAEGGTNWSDDGIPTGFTIAHMTLNGRKASNTSGYGMKLYASHYYINDVVIVRCAEVGFYSERESETGSITFWYDVPKSLITRLQVRKSDETGFLFRGPHDTYIDSLHVQACAETTGDGIRIEGTAGAVYDEPHKGDGFYTGSCEIGFVHSYGHGHDSTNQCPTSFYCSAKIKATHLYIDSARGNLCHFDGDKALVSLVRCLHAGSGTLALTSPTSPTKVFSYINSSYTDLTNTYDGSPTTSNTVSLVVNDPRYDAIFVGYSAHRFNLTSFDLGSTVNAVTADFNVFYYSTEDSDWRQIGADKLTDTTNPAGKCFAQDGEIEHHMEFHSDWATNSVNGTTAYWIKLVPYAGEATPVTLTANIVINEITVDHRRWCLIQSGDENNLGTVQTTDDKIQSGVKIVGNKNQIAALKADGNSDSTGIGLFISGDHNNVEGHIFDYAGSGGIGLQTNADDVGWHNQLVLNLSTCDTLWDNPQSGKSENFNIRGHNASGDTHYSGTTGPLDDTCDWDVEIWDADDSDWYYSRRGIEDSDSIALDSTTAQTINVAHRFIVKPHPHNITFGVRRSTSVSDYVVDYIRLQNAPSTTTIDIQVKLGTASGTGSSTADLLVKGEV